jgi:hypothetical protein
LHDNAHRDARRVATKKAKEWGAKGLHSESEVQHALAKATKVAVHARAIGFLPLVKQACDQEGVKFVFSATEADAQIPYLVREHKNLLGTLDGQSPIAVVNDADYAVNQGGVPHVFFMDSGKFKPELRYLAKAAFGEQPHQESSNSAGMNQMTFKPITDILVPLIGEHGYLVVRSWACMANNDYNSRLLPGFGGKKAAEILRKVLATGCHVDAPSEEAAISLILAMAAPLILEYSKKPKECVLYFADWIGSNFIPASLQLSSDMGVCFI